MQMMNDHSLIYCVEIKQVSPLVTVMWHSRNIPYQARHYEDLMEHEKPLWRKQVAQFLWHNRNDLTRFRTAQILLYRSLITFPNIQTAHIEIKMICEFLAVHKKLDSGATERKCTNNLQYNEPKNMGQLLSLETFPETNSVT